MEISRDLFAECLPTGIPEPQPPTTPMTVTVAGVAPPTPPVPATLTPPAPEKAASRPPSPSRTARLIAALQSRDVVDVVAALATAAEACRRKDHQFIEETLVGQAVLLQALSEWLMVKSSDVGLHQAKQVYFTAALRALDNSRKTYATLVELRGSPKSQTNVQVNVGAQPPANELEVSDE